MEIVLDPLAGLGRCSLTESICLNSIMESVSVDERNIYSLLVYGPAYGIQPKSMTTGNKLAQ